jgi:hypothetical protein
MIKIHERPSSLLKMSLSEKENKTLKNEDGEKNMHDLRFKTTMIF